ncbi:MAG: SH3 domain-containing protein [Bacteroidales bacterium]|nr:SH3 domain-containing protein [Bacteroidales bacterium]
MRPVLLLILACCVTTPLFAQSTPRRGQVVADSTTLRSGPSEQMPETGSLYRGATVEIDHEEPGGWLAIQPPRGQVSWINHLHVGPAPGQSGEVLPRNMIVHADPETVIAIGRAGLDHPLDVRRTKIADGTIVLVIGNTIDHAGSHWLPIEPPFGDFRYIRREAIEIGGASAAFTVKSPKVEPQPLAPVVTAAKPTTHPAAIAPAAAMPNPGNPARTETRGGNWPNHPLWLQAEQAYRDGDFTKAEQYYLRLAAEMNQPGGDADLANLCYTRIHTVREQARARTRPINRNTSTSPRPDTPAASGQWTESGVIRVAGFRIGGRTTYALVSSQGRVVAYATEDGADLERFRGYEVELYGTVSHPTDLRGTALIAVSQVRMPRTR